MSYSEIFTDEECKEMAIVTQFRLTLKSGEVVTIDREDDHHVMREGLGNEIDRLYFAKGDTILHADIQSVTFLRAGKTRVLANRLLAMANVKLSVSEAEKFAANLYKMVNADDAGERIYDLWHDKSEWFR